MITLNEIAYNIKNLAYGGSTTTENSISLRQIKHWIHYHRAKLIADNIDKGITNNQALYQDIEFNLRNSVQGDAENYIKLWDAYQLDSSASAPTITGAFLENHPRNSMGELSGEWLAIQPHSTGNGNYGQNLSYYGDEIKSSQLRGDFHNFGSHSFWMPRTLQLKNDQGIKEITLRRKIHFPDDIATAVSGTDGWEQQTGSQKRDIPLYRKEYNNFDDYNKFTDNSKPYYIQESINNNTGFKKDRDVNYISFRSIQVSPNNVGGLYSPGNKKVFWKYKAEGKLILENPTQIFIKNNTKRDIDYNLGIIKWDDEKMPYPIPMEYVSDLIQRVIQVEMQTELKTTPDIVTDGLDDIIKQKISGPQVQR